MPLFPRVASSRASAAPSASTPAFKTRNVILVTLDGIRASEAFDAPDPWNYIPNMWLKLRPQGSLYRSFYNLGATWTTPGHMAITSGCWQFTQDNLDERIMRSTCPTIFEYYRRANPDLPKEKVWAVATKEAVWAVNYSSHPGYGPAYGASLLLKPWSNTTSWAGVQELMDQHHPSLILYHMGEIDIAGHSDWDWYLTAIRGADKVVGALWDKIQSDPYYRDTTTLLVTADHGRHTLDPIGHGCHCEGCKRTFLLALGPDIQKGAEFAELREQIDIAPTVGMLLGFDTPFAEGRALTEMWVTEAEPLQAGPAARVNQPDIAVNGAGLYLVWADDRSGRDRVYFRSQSSQTGEWSEDIQLSGEGRATRAPAIAVGENTVHAVWQEWFNGDWTIYYRQRDANGQWSEPEVVPGTGGGITWEPEVALCDGAPTVVVTVFPSDVRVIRRLAAGSWSSKIISSSWKYPQYVSVSSQGGLSYLTWQDIPNTTWRSLYAASSTCGTTWSSLSSIADLPGEMQARTATHGGSAYVTWIRSPSSLYLSRRLPGSNAWSSPAVVTSSPSWRPDIAAAGELVAVTWENHAADRPGVLVKVSCDRGTTWSEPVMLSGEASAADPAVTTDGDTVYVTWRDNAQEAGRLGVEALPGAETCAGVLPTPTCTPTTTPAATMTETPWPTSTPTATPDPALTIVTLQQGVNGYAGAQDTGLYQDAPAASFAAAHTLRAGSSQQKAALLRFDPGTVPAGLMLESARLEVYAASWNGQDLPLAIHALLRTASCDQATWNQPQSGAAWGLPGANDTLTDRRDTPEDEAQTSGPGKWYGFDLTNLVREWQSGSLANNGVLLRSPSAVAGGQVYLASTEYLVPGQRPRLVLAYRSAAAVPTATPSATASPTSTPLPEVVAVLQQGLEGYSGAEDTDMRLYTSSNSCGSPQLSVGYRSERASLLRFDVGSIPVDATVLEARLELYVSGWGGASTGVDAHVVLRPVVFCEASWYQAQAGVLWGIAGCNDVLADRRSAPESSVSTTGVGRWFGLDLTAAAAGWVSGTLANHGVVLRSPAVTSTALVYFASAQSVEASQRPRLVIRYR